MSSSPGPKDRYAYQLPKKDVGKTVAKSNSTRKIFTRTVHSAEGVAVEDVGDGVVVTNSKLRIHVTATQITIM
jgi:hypothetical protein